MRLFFIAAVSQDDITYNLDLFVWAKHPMQAIALWQDYYEIDPLTQPDRIYIVPCEQPRNQEARALSWSTDLDEVPLDVANDG